MNINNIINSFAVNSKIFQNIASGFPDGFIKWKTSPEKWCLLEIINHMYDEEIEDFRARLKNILAGNTEWAPIKPAEWVKERGYIERDFNDSLNNFLSERKKSIEWLKTINVSDLEKTVIHPRFGKFNAGQMLSCWLAHDMLHIRQILHLQYQYLEESIEPYTLDYAGGW